MDLTHKSDCLTPPLPHSPTLPLATIGIAVVEHEGRYLVGVRGPDGPLPGKAEFPGGKCLAGESPRDCAVRECLEETGMAVVPVRMISEQEFAYPHGRVHLHFWLCRTDGPHTVRTEHRGFRWVAAADIPSLPFPEANVSVVRQLASEL